MELVLLELKKKKNQASKTFRGRKKTTSKTIKPEQRCRQVRDFPPEREKLAHTLPAGDSLAEMRLGHTRL